MKASIFFIWTVILVLLTHTIDAQKVLLLQKPGKTKRFMYYPGDRIAVRLGNPEFNVSGEITNINDSSCTVNGNYTFQLSKVEEVSIIRPFLNGSWRTSLLVGGVYFAGSLFNRAINHDVPLIDNTVPIASGSFIALGTTAYFFRHKHCKIEKGWKLKVLDYDIFKEDGKKQK